MQRLLLIQNISNHEKKNIIVKFVAIRLIELSKQKFGMDRYLIGIVFAVKIAMIKKLTDPIGSQFL